MYERDGKPIERNPEEMHSTVEAERLHEMEVELTAIAANAHEIFRSMHSVRKMFRSMKGVDYTDLMIQAAFLEERLRGLKTHVLWRPDRGQHPEEISARQVCVDAYWSKLMVCVVTLAELVMLAREDLQEGKLSGIVIIKSWSDASSEHVVVLGRSKGGFGHSVSESSRAFGSIGETTVKGRSKEG